MGYTSVRDRTGKRRNNFAMNNNPKTRKVSENGKRKRNAYTRVSQRTVPKNIKEIKVNKMKPKHMDYTILFTVLILVAFGIVMVFSSSYYYAMTHPTFNDKFYFVKRQGIWALVGMAAMIFMTFFNFRTFKNCSVIIYLAVNVLLIVTLFFGDSANGSTRSIFGIQPGEFAKLAIIIMLAYILEKFPNIVRNFLGFALCLIIIAIPAGIIALQNLSTAIVVFGIGVIMLFVAGVKLWYFIPLGVGGVGVGAALVLPKEYRYRLGRIQSWLDPFKDASDGGYQTVQSLYAIASGGLFGRGLGNSIQKLGYLPESYNDIIFSVICEELGLVGVAAVIILFIILIFRGIVAAINAKERYDSMIATGIVVMVAIQAVINISVVTNTIPNTGMALPFISYGGSSLLMLMISMGMLLNISCYTK